MYNATLNGCECVCKDIVMNTSKTIWGDAWVGLQIGIIVLVLLLAILGLIIAYSKFKGNDDDKEYDPVNDRYI